MISDRDLLNAAWREWQESLARRGTREVLHALPHPPVWFRDEECGFSLDHGPSLRWTCQSLEQQNRSAVKQLGAEAPDRISWPRRVPRPEPLRDLTFDEVLALVRRRLGM